MTDTAPTPTADTTVVAPPVPQVDTPAVSTPPVTPESLRAEMLGAVNDLDHTLRSVITSEVDKVRGEVATAVHATVAHVATTGGTNTASTAPAGPSTVTSDLLNLVRHPSLHVALGLAFSAVSAFTAAVPASQRGADTITGAAYALLTLIAHRLNL